MSGRFDFDLHSLVSLTSYPSMNGVVGFATKKSMESISPEMMFGASEIYIY